MSSAHKQHTVGVTVCVGCADISHHHPTIDQFIVCTHMHNMLQDVMLARLCRCPVPCWLTFMQSTECQQWVDVSLDFKSYCTLHNHYRRSFPFLSCITCRQLLGCVQSVVGRRFTRCSSWMVWYWTCFIQQGALKHLHVTGLHTDTDQSPWTTAQHVCPWDLHQGWFRLIFSNEPGR